MIGSEASLGFSAQVLEKCGSHGERGCVEVWEVFNWSCGISRLDAGGAVDQLSEYSTAREYLPRPTEARQRKQSLETEQLGVC